MKKFLPIFLSACVITAANYPTVFGQTNAALQGESPKTVEIKYRGFTVNEDQIRDLPEAEAIRRATKEQIDIVLAVGLPSNIVTFFQNVPFVLVPASFSSTGSPGVYTGQGDTVLLTSVIATIGHKPVLLHELLHAYHDLKMKDGVANEDVLRHFARAKSIAAYTTQSNMVKNPAEFFACVATTFLFGVTAQEPFQRAKIRDNQPELLAYLQSLFGPETGQYEGSLTSAPAGRR